MQFLKESMTSLLVKLFRNDGFLSIDKSNLLLGCWLSCEYDSSYILWSESDRFLLKLLRDFY